VPLSFEGCGYEERKDEVSSTLFFKKSCGNHDDYPTLINVFYTTRGIMTKLSHPKSGYNQLWRGMAYDSVETLRAIFENPRGHTGKGYRSADKARRGCAKCGRQKHRNNFSKNQWRKDPGHSKCSDCIEQGKSNIHTTHDCEEPISMPYEPRSSLTILFLGVSSLYLDSCGDTLKNESTLITEQDLLQDPTKAKIVNVSQKFRGVITTDDWFDVDHEYQPIANSIFRTLKDMYNAGGSVVIAITVGIFSVPQQISTMFEFDSSWALSAYTRRSITTTSVGRQILGDTFPEQHVYTKANFVRAPEEDCLFMKYNNPEIYEFDFDYVEPPRHSGDSPVVMHRGPNGGSLSYFGFVNPSDVSYGDIILKLANPCKVEKNGIDDQEVITNYDCIQCDADGCTRYGATINCSTCKMVFYCSQTCQRQHQHAHMLDCRVTVSIFDRFPFEPEPPCEEILRLRGLAAQLAGRQDFAGKLLIAEYWQYEENWEAAFETYRSIYDEMIYRSPPEQRQHLMGMCRCLYNMGRYDLAIDAGGSAIEMNRHFPEVHKYVAFSHKAKGDRAAAIVTMTRAVLYEAPWDEKNIKANKALLKEVQRG